MTEQTILQDNLSDAEPYPTIHDLRQHALTFARGEESFDAFEGWLITATWDIPPDADTLALLMSRKMILRVMEHLNGDWTQDQLTQLILEACGL